MDVSCTTFCARLACSCPPRFPSYLRPHCCRGARDIAFAVPDTTSSCHTRTRASYTARSSRQRKEAPSASHSTATGRCRTTTALKVSVRPRSSAASRAQGVRSLTLRLFLSSLHCRCRRRATRAGCCHRYVSVPDALSEWAARFGRCADTVTLFLAGWFAVRTYASLLMPCPSSVSSPHPLFTFCYHGLLPISSPSASEDGAQSGRSSHSRSI